MCKPGSVGDLGGQPPRSTRPAKPPDPAKPSRKPETGLDLAKKAREGRIVISLKPFRWNPAGNQSRPVEPDQQPEASLAWWVGDHPCEA